jgi:NAD(P)-dependent dehydrogenase (short-subunit alcohol dehydrogenase family)
MLFGKTTLITGAGRGIGRATATLFASEGANLILVARSQAQLDETAALCRAGRPDAGITIVPTDLSDSAQIDWLFQMLGNDAPIDILINNAAMFAAGPAAEFPVEQFHRLLDLNLLAPYHLCQKVIPLMASRGGGAIVNISSLSGCFGTTKFPGFGPYNISKYGLWGLTEILALENRKHNVRVNQISLSGVETQMFHEAAPPGVVAQLTPDQVAEEILYLASESSAPHTGGNLILDGSSRHWQSDD